jgi:PPM family protein phosphatase
MRGLAAVGVGVSDIGRVREINQDRILLLEETGQGMALFAVADGLGGHAAGNVASDLAVETLRREVPGLLAQGLAPREALVQGFRRANAEIRDRARAPERSGMGTTCTALIVSGDEGIVAHVGDSRAYLLRGAEIRQLTTDHSLAAELVRQGSVTPTDAAAHTQRHVLTRALGTENDVEIDLIVSSLRGGDRLVLTTDGLHSVVPPEELAAVIQATSDPKEACRTLVGLANARGGLDNASVVIVRVHPRWVSRVAQVLAPLALAALLAAGNGLYRLEHSYFLGVRNDYVAVLRGTPLRVLGIPLFSVVKMTPVQIEQVTPAYRSRVLSGIPARSPEDAESLLHDLMDRP